MNRQTTYFLQRVLTGLSTSIIQGLFDNYRYNNNSYNNYNNYNKKPEKREPKLRKDFSHTGKIETKYDRNNRYKQNE